MSSCCAGFCTAVSRQFDASVANGDLKRYRRKGPNPTTRLLHRGILDAGGGRTLLDVGAGIGTLSLELLAAGFHRAVLVDAAPAYLAAARREAQARAQAQAVTLVEGDFVEASGAVPDTDVVAMDRVICCYPAFRPLLEHALAKARRVFALSYPRDRWPIRVVFHLENLLRALTGNRFRAFVHSASAMGRLIEGQGFRRVSRAGTFVWAVDVYVRVPAVAAEPLTRESS